MSFLKRGDAQPILHIIDVPDDVAQNLLEKANKSKDEDLKKSNKDNKDDDVS